MHSSKQLVHDDTTMTSDVFNWRHQKDMDGLSNLHTAYSLVEKKTNIGDNNITKFWVGLSFNLHNYRNLQKSSNPKS